MRDDHDGMMPVRSELCDLLEQLRQAAEQLAVHDFCRHAEAIRTKAAACGLIPVVALTDALERAVMAQPHGRSVGLYFDRLREAIGSGGADDRASEAMPASVSIRLGG